MNLFISSAAFQNQKYKSIHKHFQSSQKLKAPSRAHSTIQAGSPQVLHSIRSISKDPERQERVSQLINTIAQGADFRQAWGLWVSSIKHIENLLPMELAKAMEGRTKADLQFAL